MTLAQDQGFATIEVLAKRFGVSAQTIRRDIIRLDELGVLQRFHRGAGLRGDVGRERATVRLGYPHKRTVSPEAKDQIGRACAELMRPGSSLFLEVALRQRLWRERSRATRG